MNGSMVEHNGLGITCFSVDILKDMVACWYAWVFKSSRENKTIASHKSPCYKEIWYDMLGSIPHQKFCFDHLPTQGRAWIKLEDVDTSPTYL